MRAAGAVLRDLLRRDSPLVAPGAVLPVFASLAEEAGFEAVYLSGAGVSNLYLGQPDIGLAGLEEMVQAARRVVDAVHVPVIADADTGYGGVHNVARTVREYEAAGVAAIQIEDQRFPKRCGHFAGKEVVPAREMLQRIEAALRTRTSPDTLIIARTDAAQEFGLDEALSRARSYGRAGADVLFVEAPEDEEMLARIGAELNDWPLVANMVEFGKTPLLPAARLGELGFSLVIYPGTLVRSLVKTSRDVLKALKRDGSSLGLLGQLATFDEVNELLGLGSLRRWEEDLTRSVATD